MRDGKLGYRIESQIFGRCTVLINESATEVSLPRLAISILQQVRPIEKRKPCDDIVSEVYVCLV